MLSGWPTHPFMAPCLRLSGESLSPRRIVALSTLTFRLLSLYTASLILTKTTRCISLLKILMIKQF